MSASAIIDAFKRGASITLPAMSGAEFKRLINELDKIRYP